tara:strand:+ start:261 stop:1574 length:1314 start_codon:yes stop_codon:yes gene_type:complete
MKNKKIKISVIGGGYVGLPLAIELGRYFDTILIDKDKERVRDINRHIDNNHSVSKKDFLKSKYLKVHSSLSKSKECNIYILTLPTPIDHNNIPDLSILKNVTKKISKYINHDDLLIYESTVYPGATIEVFKPIIEKISKLKLFVSNKNNFNNYFHLGYSPERINPSDKKNKLVNTKKIISGSSFDAINKVRYIYKKIIKAGVHETNKIEEAESAKLLENIQRDCNISIINEYSVAMRNMGIDFKKVLEASTTKWNFNKFNPGLVGGHCLAVDPYYLIYKSKKMNYFPKIISTCRKFNDDFYLDIILRIKKLFKEKFIKFDKLNILIMGISYKENCPDTRNSQIFKIIKELKRHKNIISVFDPMILNKALNRISKKEKIKIYKSTKSRNSKFDLILYCLDHNKFKKYNINKLNSLLNNKGIIFDLTQRFNSEDVDEKI